MKKLLYPFLILVVTACSEPKAEKATNESSTDTIIKADTNNISEIQSIDGCEIRNAEFLSLFEKLNLEDSLYIITSNVISKETPYEFKGKWIGFHLFKYFGKEGQVKYENFPGDMKKNIEQGLFACKQLPLDENQKLLILRTPSQYGAYTLEFAIFNCDSSKVTQQMKIANNSGEGTVLYVNSLLTKAEEGYQLKMRQEYKDLNNTDPDWAKRFVSDSTITYTVNSNGFKRIEEKKTDKKSDFTKTIDTEFKKYNR